MPIKIFTTYNNVTFKSFILPPFLAHCSINLCIKSIKNNKDFVKDLSVTNEIEPLGSSATYDKETILYDVSLIETITDLPAKYCFTKYANSDTLKVCSNYQLQTVRPTILTGNYPLTKIKNNLTNGAIISFDMTSIVRKELSVSINYIRQKGYDFLTLSELLSEEMK